MDLCPKWVVLQVVFTCFVGERDISAAVHGAEVEAPLIRGRTKSFFLIRLVLLLVKGLRCAAPMLWSKTGFLVTK